jgi:hypothetical protein
MAGPSLQLRLEPVSQSDTTITVIPGEVPVINETEHYGLSNLIMGLNFLRAGCPGIQLAFELSGYEPICVNSSDCMCVARTGSPEEKAKHKKEYFDEPCADIIARWKTFLQTAENIDEDFKFHPIRTPKDQSAGFYCTMLITRTVS